ncbi:unnamed protein product [Moneuplotes crassus]|uniref:RNA helicase n=1 Tax=Euplotes crassus TaxID=5936 RepID=A0AAD1XBC2_EUPCR|nr:unnamed protein product [Moneuplotes crassus]
MEDYGDTSGGGEGSGSAERFDDRPLNGLGGYGDEDYSDVKSLVAQNKGQNQQQVENFNQFPEITPETVTKLQGLGISYLFPIQAECFRPIYSGKDVIGRDLTGSGKTLAFCVPLVEKFRKEGLIGSGKSSLKAIILAPTRELALQVSKVLKCLRHHGDEFRVITVYGGVPIHVQTKELQSGVDFFVGTTGRVMDHIRRGNINFTAMRAVVLDEADQMLNMGFAEDIETIMKSLKEKTNTKQQFILFSATIPDWFKNTAENYMEEDYLYINLAENLKNKTPRNVTHILVRIPSSQREEILAKVMARYLENDKSKAIVFTTTKNDAREISQSSVFGGKAEALHGDVPQRSREFVLKRFRQGRTSVLVATDVASRGLDIPRVDLIVQIEPPRDPEQYIHRSGRTARAGNAGVCVTFCDSRDEQWIEKIIDQAGIDFKELDWENNTDHFPSHNSMDGGSSGSRSLLIGVPGFITYQVAGLFANKGDAYNKCIEVFGRPLTDSFKNTTPIDHPNAIIFDIIEAKEQEMVDAYERARREGPVGFELEKVVSLPTGK